MIAFSIDNEFDVHRALTRELGVTDMTLNRAVWQVLLQQLRDIRRVRREHISVTHRIVENCRKYAARQLENDTVGRSFAFVGC